MCVSKAGYRGAKKVGAELMVAKSYTNDLTELPKVMALHFYRMMHCRTDLEELESIGNLAFMEAMGRFKPELSHDGEDGRRPFVAQAIRLTMLKYLFPFKRTQAAREKRLRVAYLDDKVATRSDSVELRIIDILGKQERAYKELDDREEFERLISILPVDGHYRELIHLYVIEGLSYQELADRWGVSRQRVGQIMLRAIDRLKEHRYRNGDPRRCRQKGRV